MARWTALLLVLCVLLCPKAGAADSGEDAFTPLYEGSHVLPAARFPRLPPDIPWGMSFREDTNIVLARSGWYLAEVTCLVDESGQVRETLVTETMPTRNLSASMVDELRRQRFVAGLGPNGPIAGLFSFRIVYVMQQRLGDLGFIAGRLRRAADKGDAGAQYTLSRVMLANVALNKTGLDSDALLRSAADPGRDRRAMLALGVMTREFPAGQDPAKVVAERRGWVLKAARAGYGPAQMLVALDSWAEQTAAGHARARHWLELANRAKDPVAPKYLAALLVSHSDSPADWKAAHELALATSRDWHGRNDPDVWQVLAAASALTGDFPAAVEAQNKATALAASAKWAPEAFERRLASYRESRTMAEEIIVIPAVAHTIASAAPGAQAN